jgi:hypothetical protein
LCVSIFFFFMMPPSHDRPLPDFCASGEAHPAFPSGTVVKALRAS